jgi:hypothetical protein
MRSFRTLSVRNPADSIPVNESVQGNRRTGDTTPTFYGSGLKKQVFVRHWRDLRRWKTTRPTLPAGGIAFASIICGTATYQKDNAYAHD